MTQPDPENAEGPVLTPTPQNIDLSDRLFCCHRLWEDRNKGTALETFVEGHAAIDSCKDRVVLAHANAFTRPPLGAALAHDDVARDHFLTAEFLHAKATTG